MLRRHRFLIWAATSLTGHVVFFELIFAIPMAIIFTYLNYIQGTLTVSWAIWIVGLSAAVSIIISILIWTTITMPRIKRRD
jgi:hypothetical protein